MSENSAYCYKLPSPSPTVLPITKCLMEQTSVYTVIMPMEELGQTWMPAGSDP